MRSTADDPTARARIRDAAVRRFAADGFGVGVRVIAQDAGVSAGLVIHHFGSKDALRAECDRHVLDRIRQAKEEALTDAGASTLLASLASIEEFAPLVEYCLRSLQAGGDLAREFVDHFVADAQQYLAAGVRAGTIRPSRDEAARARYLTLQAMGALSLEFALRPDDERSDDFGAFVRRHFESLTLPSLELYSEGLLTTREMLDAYLLYVGDPPAPDAPGTPAQ